MRSATVTLGIRKFSMECPLSGRGTLGIPVPKFFRAPPQGRTGPLTRGQKLSLGLGVGATTLATVLGGIEVLQPGGFCAHGKSLGAMEQTTAYRADALLDREGWR